MPILVQTLNNNIKAKLDAEGSDRYTFDQDIKYAINASMETLIILFNRAFDSDKLSPEALRELIKIKVWQTSSYSRFKYKESDTGHTLWTIFGIFPKCVVNKGVSASPVAQKYQSKFRNDLSYISSKQSAKRLTLEEWNENADNVFMAGNTKLTGSLVEYAYINFADYTSANYDANSGDAEIEVRPAIPGELVAMAYLKNPKKVSLITDSIEFPASLEELITEICLNHLSVKQGDGTSLFQVTDLMVTRLAGLMR